MKELLEYRTSLIEKLVHTAEDFRTACLAAPNPFAPLEGAWNLHQIAAHTRDVDQLVYGARARRTALEQNPEFQNFDGEVYMEEHYSASEPLQQIVDQLVANVEDLAQILRGLPDEAWSRESRHATLGKGLTLQAWVERGLAHMQEHLKTIESRKDQ